MYGSVLYWVCFRDRRSEVRILHWYATFKVRSPLGKYNHVYWETA